MSTTHPTKPAPSEEALCILVEEFIRELAAYRKETLLYPPGHPRLAGRITALHEALRTHLHRHGSLALKVRSDGLACAGLAIGPGVQACVDFAVILRERLIQDLVFLPGVTTGEIEGLIQLLLLTPQRALERDANEGWEHIRIERFQHFFDAEEPVGGEAMEIDGEDGQVTIFGRLPAELTRRLSQGQLVDLVEFMQSDQVGSRLTSLREMFRDGDGQIDFVQNFFTLLATDGHLDWSDETAVQGCIVAAFDLLKEAATKKDGSESIPTNLLVSQNGLSDQLATHFRWRILKNFFPGEVASRSPRAAEDLSFVASESQSREPQVVVPQEGWGATTPEELRDPFRLQFLPRQMVPEYAGVGHHLITEAVAPDEIMAAEDQYLSIIRQQLDDMHDVGLILPLVVRQSVDAPFDRLAPVLTRLVRFAEAKDCLNIIAGGSADALEVLLSRPPLPLEEEITLGDARLQRPRELLRRLLLARDAFALDVVLHTLTGPKAATAQSNGWLDVFETLMKKNRAFAPWMRRNAHQLFQPEGLGLLFRIPYGDLRLELTRYFSEVDEQEAKRFFHSVERNHSETAVRILILGLEIDSREVRETVIAVLSRHPNPKSLQALQGLLEQINGSLTMDDQAQTVCDAVARLGRPEASALLNRVVSERHGLKRVWKRCLRRAAKSALRNPPTEPDAAAEEPS